VPSLSSIPSFTNGTVPTAANLQTIATNLDTIAQLGTAHPLSDGATQRPATKARLLNTQSILNATDTVINWDLEEVDSDHHFSINVGTTFLILTPGWYRVELQVAYDFQSDPGALAPSERAISICVNGTANANVVATHNTLMRINNNQRLQVSAWVHAAFNTNILGRTYQASGAALNLLPQATAAASSSAWGTWMSVTYEAPY
jgi:hypothetical protein